MSNAEERDRIKKFFRETLGVKSDAVLQKLVENSRICKYRAREIIEKENEKVTQIPFLLNEGGIVKAYYKNGQGKNQIHCFGYMVGEPLVGFITLRKTMTSLFSVEAVTECEVINTSAAVIYKLSLEYPEVTMLCNHFQGMREMREYEYRKLILNGTPAEKYEYFSETYPELAKKIAKKDIASYLNMTPECFSRTLKQMKTTGGGLL